MRTARSSSRPGGLHQAPLDQAPPGAGTPLDQASPTPQDQTPPGTRHTPPGADPPPRDQAPLLWTEFLTHAYENITLPQTSFAGGNKNILKTNTKTFKIKLWKKSNWK